MHINGIQFTELCKCLRLAKFYKAFKVLTEKAKESYL